MTSSLQTARVVELISRVVAPHVGETVASTAGPMHCERLGLTGESLTPAELSRLLASLERGLAVFLGNPGATKAVAEVRKALKMESGT